MIGCGDRKLGGQGDLELVAAVLRVQLLYAHTGGGGGGGDVADETLVLEDAGQAVLRPQRGGKLAAVGGDEHELDLVSDQCAQPGFGKRRFDPGQRSATARGNGHTVLIEE